MPFLRKRSESVTIKFVEFEVTRETSPISQRSAIFPCDRREFLLGGGAAITTCAMSTAGVVLPGNAHAMGLLSIFLTMASGLTAAASFLNSASEIARTIANGFSVFSAATDELQKNLAEMMNRRGQKPQAALGFVNLGSQPTVATANYFRSPPLGNVEFTRPVPIRAELLNKPELFAATTKAPEYRQFIEVQSPPGSGQVGMIFADDGLQDNRVYGTAAKGPTNWTQSWDAQLLRTI